MTEVAWAWEQSDLRFKSCSASYDEMILTRHRTCGASYGLDTQEIAAEGEKETQSVPSWSS